MPPDPSRRLAPSVLDSVVSESELWAWSAALWRILISLINPMHIYVGFSRSPAKYVHPSYTSLKEALWMKRFFCEDFNDGFRFKEAGKYSLRYLHWIVNIKLGPAWSWRRLHDKELKSDHGQLMFYRVSRKKYILWNVPTVQSKLTCRGLALVWI